MKRWMWITLAVVGGAQLIRPSRTSEPIDPTSDLLTLTKPAPGVERLIRTTCYDCHSGQPRYPWYVNITPVNWWMQHHIDEGRHHFDASAWGRYSTERRSHVAEEAMEMVSEGEMPLGSYTWTHSDARLSEADRRALVSYFGTLR